MSTSLTESDLSLSISWIKNMEALRNMAAVITPKNKEEALKYMDEYISECSKIVTEAHNK